MQPEDLDAVTQIDQISFTSPWPQNAFKYELLENDNAVCWIAESVDPDRESSILGMLVLWLVIDEVQIATIAIQPEGRRRGIGDALIRTALLDAVEKGANKAILEVRAGNYAAINLYQKYGFKIVGRRKRYYQDNHEDAILMTLFDLDGSNYQADSQASSEFNIQD